MKASIIKIGNSKGIRLPKVMLEETKFGNVGDKVDLKMQGGEIIVSPSTEAKVYVDEGTLLSYSALAKEWNTPEEDAAWASLQ